MGGDQRRPTMTDKEIDDVSAEIHIRDAPRRPTTHESDEYQLLAAPNVALGPAFDQEFPAEGTSVTLRLADGDSMVRVTLDDEQTRRLVEGLESIWSGGDDG